MDKPLVNTAFHMWIARHRNRSTPDTAETTAPPMGVPESWMFGPTIVDERRLMQYRTNCGSGDGESSTQQKHLSRLHNGNRLRT